MFRMTSISAYDALGMVVIHATVRVQTDDVEDVWRTEIAHTATISSVGEDDPREWLRDALVGLLEEI